MVHSGLTHFSQPVCQMDLASNSLEPPDNMAAALPSPLGCALERLTQFQLSPHLSVGQSVKITPDVYSHSS